MSDTVKVRIQMRGRWEYCQDVEMTRQDFEKYDKALDDASGRTFDKVVAEISGLYVNPRDVEFEDADDLDDFRLAEDDTP